MLTYGQKTSQDVSCMTTWDETVLHIPPVQQTTKIYIEIVYV